MISTLHFSFNRWYTQGLENDEVDSAYSPNPAARPYSDYFESYTSEQPGLLYHR